MKRLLYLPIIVAILAGAVFFARHDIGMWLVRAGDSYFGGSRGHNLLIADLFYRAALVVDPSHYAAHHQLARTAFIRGEFDTALREIDTQLALHGRDFMASYYIKGLIHGYRKEFPEAETNFLAFLEWDPENWAALNDLAWVYFAQGKFDDSLQAAEKGLRVDPDSPWLLTMRAMSRFNLEDPQGALGDLLAAKEAAAHLRESDWLRSYPGNDPAVAAAGLASVRRTIEDNIELVNRELRGR